MEIARGAKVCAIAGAFGLIVALLFTAWAGVLKLNPLGWAGDVILVLFAVSVSAITLAVIVQIYQTKGK